MTWFEAIKGEAAGLKEVKGAFDQNMILKVPFYYGKPDWLVVVIELIPVCTILTKNLAQQFH